MLSLFQMLVLSLDQEPHSLSKFMVNWRANYMYTNGQYGDNFTKSFFKVRKFKLNNGTIGIDIEMDLSKKSFSYQFQFSDELVSVFNENSELVLPINYHFYDDNTISLHGVYQSQFNVVGILSLSNPSQITFSSRVSDEVYIVQLIAPVKLTFTDYFVKLSPAFAIVFFMGFGRYYRSRFWKQFNQMNTRTLQRAINEAK